MVSDELQGIRMDQMCTRAFLQYSIGSFCICSVILRISVANFCVLIIGGMRQSTGKTFRRVAPGISKEFPNLWPFSAISMKESSNDLTSYPYIVAIAMEIANLTRCKHLSSAPRSSTDTYILQCSWNLSGLTSRLPRNS